MVLINPIRDVYARGPRPRGFSGHSGKLDARAPRPHTRSPAELRRDVARHTTPAEPEELPPRPCHTGECADVPRPCPYVGCRHHLYLDVDPQSGSIKFNFPHLDPLEMPPDASCSLDVARRGGLQLEGVAACMNITREAARQMIESALHRAGVAAGDDPVLARIQRRQRRALR